MKSLNAVLYRFFLLSLVALAGACSDPGQSPVTAEPDLTGKIWDVDQQEFVEPADIVRRLKDLDYLLLGEKHDNMTHHDHQTWFIRQLHRLDRRASVAFEMIDHEQGKRLARHDPKSVEHMIELLQPDDPGWQYEQRYKDLFAAALAAGYPVRPANLSRKQLLDYVSQEDRALPSIYRDILDETPFTPQQMATLQQEIRESHCNMLPEENIPMMVDAQRLRDAVMAASLRRSDTPVTVLIAGNRHVRNDRGVPVYLDKGRTILTVGFIEVIPDRNTADAYRLDWDDRQLPFDLVWFTPRPERTDPCKQFQQP